MIDASCKEGRQNCEYSKDFALKDDLSVNNLSSEATIQCVDLKCYKKINEVQHLGMEFSRGILSPSSDKSYQKATLFIIWRVTASSAFLDT
ncbi:hypothetical protein E2C01_076794 [Portunus trituberculatus]|uniref:Uncharacterized protein n=1 Tax=Portunus trituberculatus TaxID=210409 RepID=A0A5B7IMY5_PORTR|nr:hypothetical protein [Portunus trituberculatus]